jgi:deazaflavin-dependent oxidoreductase (nitroreductase family)
VTLPPELAGEEFCYLTTTGRVSGKPHEIEIWFALQGATAYMLAGGGLRADWVANLRKTPAVTLRIGETTFAAQGRIITGMAEDALARRLLLEKYQPGYKGDLSDWGRTALPVAIHLRRIDTN